MSAVVQDLKFTKQALETLLAEAQAGHAVSLDGMEVNVAALCEAVAALPRPEAQACIDDMEAMIQTLDELMTVLKEAHDAG